MWRLGARDVPARGAGPVLASLVCACAVAGTARAYTCSAKRGDAVIFQHDANNMKHSTQVSDSTDSGHALSLGHCGGVTRGMTARDRMPQAWAEC